LTKQSNFEKQGKTGKVVTLAQISKSEISSRLLQNPVINYRQDENFHCECCLGSKPHKTNKELKMRFAAEILVQHCQSAGRERQTSTCPRPRETPRADPPPALPSSPSRAASPSYPGALLGVCPALVP